MITSDRIIPRYYRSSPLSNHKSRSFLHSISNQGLKETLPFFDPYFLPHPKKMEVGKANSVYSQNGVLSLVCDPGKSS